MQARHAVLIVDDDRTCREVVQRLLEKRGYEVLSAASPNEALDVLARKPISLLVLDYQMPQMSGVELYRRALDLVPQAVAVFVTSECNAERLVAAVEAGVAYLLAKPVDGDALGRLVDVLADSASTSGEYV